MGPPLVGSQISMCSNSANGRPEAANTCDGSRLMSIKGSGFLVAPWMINRMYLILFFVGRSKLDCPELQILLSDDENREVISQHLFHQDIEAEPFNEENEAKRRLSTTVYFSSPENL